VIALDVGCGDKSTVPSGWLKEYDWYYLDKFNFADKYPVGRFTQHDLKDTLPFAEGSVDHIWCHHVVEHLPPRHPTIDIDLLVYVVNEFHRVLKVGGEAHIIVPWMEHTNAWRCPTHYRFFNYETFVWFGHWQSMPGEMSASGVVGHWRVPRCEVIDKTHVYAVLLRVE
jgi:SAM-dependent methyltransferase